jgi:hypothetical protein
VIYCQFFEQYPVSLLVREGKISPYNMPRTPTAGVEVYIYFFFNLGAGWSGWSTPCSGHFTPRKDPVHIVQEAGYVPGSVHQNRDSISGPSSLSRVAAPSELHVHEMGTQY